MLRILGWVIKTAVLCAIILVLGNLIRFQGMTVSDQVRIRLSHAERSSSSLVDQVKDWKREIAQDIADYVSPEKPAPAKLKARKNEKRPEEGDIPSSERQKLRALIRDLNNSPGTSHGRD